MNPQIFTALITLSVGIMATAFTFKNYRLNKTLNIKNNMFNEKLKVYREISKNLGELIVELDEIEKELSKNNAQILDKHAIWVDCKCKQINVQILEASVILPKKVLLRLSKLIEILYFSGETAVDQNDHQLYQEKVNELRESAKDILKLFRKDLKIKTLNNQNLKA